MVFTVIFRPMRLSLWVGPTVCEATLREVWDLDGTLWRDQLSSGEAHSHMPPARGWGAPTDAINSRIAPEEVSFVVAMLPGWWQRPCFVKWACRAKVQYCCLAVRMPMHHAWTESC